LKKPLFYLTFLLLTCISVQAQKITPADMRQLAKQQDSLKLLAKNLLIDSFTAGRMRNDSQFVKTLVRSLQVKNSFYYPFDSVRGIGKVYAPDSTFRIITWQLSFDDYYCRQRGAIQFRTADGSLKLIPLRDNSEFTFNANDSIRNKDTWIGAVYYNMIVNEFNGKKYYTLFGFDANSVRSNKKWIDVLSFDERNMPVFGGRFNFSKDSIKRKNQARFSIEYKKDASTMLNYEPELQLILVDHLVSETDEPEFPYTFIPDGDYEGFRWEKGEWVHVDKVFTEKVDMKGVDPLLGNAPVGDPLLDKNGNRDEKKLEEKTKKNQQKKKTGGD
jgi:hypothetical protein